MRGRFLLSTEQAALDRFPTEIDPDDLTSCFSLTDEDPPPRPVVTCAGMSTSFITPVCPLGDADGDESPRFS
jgi:hypothetical protein